MQGDKTLLTSTFWVLSLSTYIKFCVIIRSWLQQCQLLPFYSPGHHQASPFLWLGSSQASNHQFYESVNLFLQKRVTAATPHASLRFASGKKLNALNKRKETMPKKDEIEVEGKVLEALPNAMFKVEIDEQHQVLAVLSGRIRMNFVRIVPGDKVRVVLSPYDLTRGRITWRVRS